MDPASSPMHVSHVMMTLPVLHLPMITRTVLRRKGADHPLIEAVPGIDITMLRGVMPRRIATLIDADPIVIRNIGIDTSATLMQKGTSQMTMKQMTFPIAEVRLSKGIPPVGGMNMTVQLRLITS